MQPERKGFSLYAYIATLFVTLLLVFAAITITAQYIQTKNMLLVSAGALFERIGEQTRQGLGRITEPAIISVRLLSRTRLVTAETEEARLNAIPLLFETLQSGAQLSAAYIGYDDGDFISVRPIDPETDWGRLMTPPAGAAYLVQSMTHDASGRSGRYLFFDKDRVLIENRPVPNYRYDPRTRGWFKAADGTRGPSMSAPYIFFTTRQVGVTFSLRSPDGPAVVGIDVTLDFLSDVLSASKATPSSLLAIVDEAAHVLASSEGKQPSTVDANGAPVLPKVADLKRPVLEQIAGRAYAAQSPINSFDVDGVAWQTYYAPLINGDEPISLAIATPQREILAEADRQRIWMLLISLVALTAATLAALIIARLISRSLDRLTRAARDFNALKFDGPFDAHSFVVEIDRLAGAMGAMKNTISRLLAIGALLGGEKKFDRLLDEIVAETISITGARGGIVYLTEPDGSLAGALARFDGRQLSGLPPPGLRAGANDDHPAVQAATHRATIETEVTAEQVERWYPGFEHRQAYRVMAVPLKNREGDLVGVLMLSQNPGVRREEVARADAQAFVEAVSGTAAVAIETNRLILEQKRLMLAIIELLAGAIDAKSPYTSGHCQRVPVLTEMLAKAAEEASEGPFKGFKLSEEEWEELHIAGWLHDCGKVTSPEFVIDKATKLETITDRLHEVRMRFEVIKREAEAACWKEIAEGGLDGEARQARLETLQRLWLALDEEFAFVAESNVGGEFMAPERIARLKEIATRTWTRTLDDRIGLSHEETQRKSRTLPPSLPVVEPLLADRPEHIIVRGERDQIAADNPWGFKVDVPELLYNRGEIYNLTVARGTLTEEERFKINAHMIETIRMLTRLPLPRHLRNVPEIAGGHHEKMDGSGYPKRLKRDEMSVPARMMAVADIFEALTAADRPYKKAKSLSESISIMAKMRDNAHIDPEIFDLFLKSGVYRQYAERFMQPDQIDAVPIKNYMSA